MHSVQACDSHLLLARPCSVSACRSSIPGLRDMCWAYAPDYIIDSEAMSASRPESTSPNDGNPPFATPSFSSTPFNSAPPRASGSKDFGGQHRNAVGTVQLGGGFDKNQHVGGMSYYSGGGQFGGGGGGNTQRLNNINKEAFRGCWPNG